MIFIHRYGNSSSYAAYFFHLLLIPDSFLPSLFVVDAVYKPWMCPDSTFIPSSPHFFFKKIHTKKQCPFQLSHKFSSLFLGIDESN